MKTIFFCLFALPLLAQPTYDAKRNYQWITGYNYFTDNPEVEHVLFDFNTDSVEISYFQRLVSSETRGTNGSICDENGQLLLYSTGCRVHEADGTLIPGTDTMNAGYTHDTQCFQISGNPSRGYTVPQGLMFLPVSKNAFFIFYLWLDYKENQGYHYFRLYNMYLKKELQTDHYAAYDVNSLVLADTLQGSLGAVRHANGQDWWLVCPKSNTNTYFVFLIDSSGVKHQITQSLGASRSYPYDNTTGQCAFSPDGSKFIEYSIKSDLKIFDFDRCTGELSNPVHIPITDAADYIFSAGAVVSPNSKYLYITSSNHIYQFDLQADDIPATRQTVAVYDGVTMGFLALDFGNSELAPDGKIYISNFAGRTTYHRIDYPDSAGLACHVVQHAEWTTYPVWTLPHHPNYLLGPLEGSGCDTITSIKPINTEITLKIFPNPVVADLTIEIEGNNGQQGTSMQLVVHNQLGQRVAEQYVAPYSPLVKISANGWKPGIYYVQLTRHGRVLAVEKIVKMP